MNPLRLLCLIGHWWRDYPLLRMRRCYFCGATRYVKGVQ